MKNNRVVITGMGVIAPNANGLENFAQALATGKSGIRFVEKMQAAKFACQVGGIPQGVSELAPQYFSADDLLAMNESMIYAGMAAIDCWQDAGLPPVGPETPVDYATGAIIGTGIGGMDTIGEKLIKKVDQGQTRRLGSTLVEQVMCSSVSATVGGLLALGGQVTTNSSACTTGTEALVNAYFSIASGFGQRILAGGAEGSSLYTWSGFDGMKVLNGKQNENPEQASRPLSATAAGFIPGAGAGILMLESLASAQERGARIYAEIIGAWVNSGGQRNGGTMSSPNPQGVIRCIRQAVAMAKIRPQEIDAINGHLTATFADPKEVHNWLQALELSPAAFPKINATKSMIGHGLGAAGGMECIGAILQLTRGFLHPSLNCEDLHPELVSIADSVVHQREKFEGQIIAKSSFGFGDVNGCVIFKKWE